MLKKVKVLLLLWSCLSLITVNAQTSLQKLTGSHTRVVWVRDFSGKNRHHNSREYKSKLVGFDSIKNHEYIILDKLDGYHKPLITPDGKQVVFSNHRDNNIYVVNWDGSKLKKIIKGNLADVCYIPADKTVWIYYQTGNNKKYPLYRLPLTGKGKPELIWNKTPINVDNFQISRNGKYASGLFPWPKGGVAELPNKKWEILGSGCWTSLAPDNSKLFWIFDGPHRNVYVTTANHKKWKVTIGNAPEIDGFEVYHPRWSNSPRVMTITGPYVGKGGHPGGNRIRSGYRHVEVYVGHFSEDYLTIDDWVKITKNKVGDYFPDAWVEGGEKINIPADIAQGKMKALKVKTLASAEVNKFTQWPGTDKGLIFLWKHSQAQNQLTMFNGKSYSTQMRLRGNAIYGLNYQVELTGGAALIEGADKNILQSCKKTNQLTIEAAITTAKAKQSGPARVISFSSNAGSRNFTLGQNGQYLVLRLRTSQTNANGTNPQITLGKIKLGQPTHVIVSFASGHLTCYINGKKSPVSNCYYGDFSNWKPQHLLFGDEWDGHRDWAGSLSDVAIYNRYFSQLEAIKHYQLWRNKFPKQKQVDTITVTAVLEQKTATPNPRDIAPYRRCLAEYRYKVISVDHGTLAAKQLVVNHWVILDGKKITVPITPGITVQFKLQKFSEHHELESERLVSNIDEIDLKRFVLAKNQPLIIKK